jgi:hypothetical protein
VPVALLALIIAFAHPASGNGPGSELAFGRAGGKPIPFSVVIAPNGAVSVTGAAPRHRDVVSKARLVEVNRLAAEIGFTRIASSPVYCPATPNEIPLRFVRIGRHTIRAHGTCVKRFNRIWTALNQAVAP